MSILVAGGAGFIGSNFVHDWFRHADEPVVTLDALTYAGNRDNLAALDGDARHLFVHGSIGDAALVGELLRRHEIRAVVNFAAESHVDRSIASPAPFFETNVMATLGLLEAVRHHLATLPAPAQAAFRLLHVSTDEVYGTLEPDDAPFSETTPYKPNSPYAASKAASDHLVRAYCETYGLPAIITNCSNNYGPFQFPEKLIPLVLLRALRGETLPVYGDGQQVRDWLHVGDHATALRTVLANGRIGETYNIGGDNQTTNLTVVEEICRLLDAKRPRTDGQSYRQQIRHVTDRPGHDRRYAVDIGKINRELGWRPATRFADGLAATIDWYLANPGWVEAVSSGAYRQWVERQYA